MINDRSDLWPHTSAEEKAGVNMIKSPQQLCDTQQQRFEC